MAESLREDIAKLESRYAANPNGRVFAHLAEAYRRAGDAARAREILDEGLRLHPDSASGYIVLGRLLEDAADPEEAEAAFTHVLALDPENRVALRALGDIARAAGRRRDALAHYQRLYEVDPSDEEAAALVAEASAAMSASEPETTSGESAAVMADAPEAAVPEIEPLVAKGPGAAAEMGSAAVLTEITIPGAVADTSPAGTPPAGLERGPASPDQPVTYAATEPAPVAGAPEATEHPRTGWGAGPVLMTETMGDLFRAQGHLEQAAGVYRGLLRDRAGDAKLEAKLSDVERALAAAAPPAAEPAVGEPGERLPAMEAVWSEGGEVPAGEPTPYAWEQVAEEEGGRPVGEYLRSLLAWRRTPPVEEALIASFEVQPPVSVTEAELAEASPEPTPYEYEPASDVALPPFDGAVAESPAGELALPVADATAHRPGEYVPAAAQLLLASGIVPEDVEARAPVHEAVAEAAVVEEPAEAVAPIAAAAVVVPEEFAAEAEGSSPEAMAAEIEEVAGVETPPEEMAAEAHPEVPVAGQDEEAVADVVPAEFVGEAAAQEAVEPVAAEAQETAPEAIAAEIEEVAGVEAAPEGIAAEAAPEFAPEGVAPEVIAAEAPVAVPAEVAAEAAPEFAPEGVAPELVVAEAPIAPLELVAMAPEVAAAEAPVAPLEPITAMPEVVVAEAPIAPSEPPAEEVLSPPAPVAHDLVADIYLAAEAIAPEHVVEPVPERAAEAVPEPPRMPPEPVAPPKPRATGAVVVNPWKTPPATGPIWEDEAGEDSEAAPQREVVWKLDPTEAAKEEGAAVPPPTSGKPRPEGKRPTPEPRKGAADSKRDDDDLGMFRAWLQSLRK